MASESVDLEMVREMVREALGEVMPPADVKCTAIFPHPELSYQRGPNIYHCRCGQTYRKDGAGGLREVT